MALVNTYADFHPRQWLESLDYGTLIALLLSGDLNQGRLDLGSSL